MTDLLLSLSLGAKIRHHQRGINAHRRDDQINTSFRFIIVGLIVENGSEKIQAKLKLASE